MPLRRGAIGRRRAAQRRAAIEIEAAGNSRAFGPLPDGWEADVLPVSFYFKPTQ